MPTSAAAGKELAAKGHNFSQQPVEPLVWQVMFDRKLEYTTQKPFWVLYSKLLGKIANNKPQPLVG